MYVRACFSKVGIWRQELIQPIRTEYYPDSSDPLTFEPGPTVPNTPMRTDSANNID